jgi:5-methylcytosine-specific restriction endonuclease McrA
MGWVILAVIVVGFGINFALHVAAEETDTERIAREQRSNQRRREDEEFRKRQDAELLENRYNRLMARNTAEDVRAELAADRSLAWRVYVRDNHRCVRCGADGTDPRNDLTVDHKIPVSHGGTNTLLNLETLCRTWKGQESAVSQ